jgi:hypothetical protein
MISDFEVRDTFRGKFRRVFRELDNLKTKICLKEGIFFKKHVFSLDDLLRSEHHDKIYSITEKIGSDAAGWARNGRLSPEAEADYFHFRDMVDSELDHINRLIITRNPTWWEKCRNALESFAQVIMKNLPLIVKQLLLGDLPAAKLLPRRFDD